MGVEVAIASLVVSTISSVEQHQQASNVADEREEQVAIRGAEEEVRLAGQRRRNTRERLVREARIRQSAANTGTTGSSGELGSLSILSTNVAANAANVNRGVLTSGALTASAQSEANSIFRSQIAGAVGGIANNVFSTALSNPETAKQFGNIFKGE